MGRTHGIDGTVVLSDTVGVRTPLPAGTVVGIGYARDFTKEYVIEAFSADEHRTTMKVRGVSTPEQAEALIDQAVYTSAEAIGVADTDRYSIAEIESCTVVLEGGEHLGTVTDVWLLPANDVWVVTTANGTIPLPVIDEVILNVDIPNRQITVRLLPGLESVDTASPDDESDA